MMKAPHTNSPQEVCTELLKHRTFLLTTHVNPDADAIGSVLGMKYLLEQIPGAQTTVVLPTSCPYNLQWLPGADTMYVWGANGYDALPEVECIVVVDLNSLTRLQSLGVAIKNSTARIVNVDHHTYPEDFAHVQWIDITAASASQLVVGLALLQESFISADMAQCLYTGIMSDSGSFRFPRTTAQLFRTVATLVDAGADPVAAYERTFNVNPLTRTRLLGKVLADMQIHHAGRLCIMIVRQQDFLDFDCTVEDTEGFVQHTLNIDGVQMGVLIIELPNQVKCSFRSKGSVYVRDLAATYGGGGHVYAAGARIPGRSLDEVVNEIVVKAASALDIPDVPTV